MVFEIQQILHLEERYLVDHHPSYQARYQPSCSASGYTLIIGLITNLIRPSQLVSHICLYVKCFAYMHGNEAAILS